MNKEKNLLQSRKKYVTSRIDDIVSQSNITPSLTIELRELVAEYKILQKTTNDLPEKIPEKKKRLRYPHEFYKDKNELFFSNS